MYPSNILHIYVSKVVLDKWKSEFFSTLYKSIQSQHFNKVCLEQIKQLNQDMESCRTIGDNGNIFLSCDISYDEVEYRVNKSKMNKSVGFE